VRVLRRPAPSGAVALAALLLPVGSMAQPAAPDWPCVQRLVSELAAGQMWGGPPPPPESWAAAPEIAGLALELARPELKLPEAERLVAGFAAAQPAGSLGPRLALLLAGVLEIVNGKRAQVIAGIVRYARSQQALARRITEESTALRDLRPGPDVVPPPELAPTKQAREWDIRIFEDRQRALRLVCEQPVVLEQRAFALARIIEAHLP